MTENKTVWNKGKPAWNKGKAPWNKDKAVGGKKPFTPMQVRILKGMLKKEDAIQELALLSLATDSFLRACDLLKIKVGDVIDYKGNPKTEVHIKQQKTGHPVTILIGEETGKCLLELIKRENKYEESFLFTARHSGKIKKTPMSRGKYAKIIKGWCSKLDLDPYAHATHTPRKGVHIIWDGTKDIEVCKLALGQKNINSTVAYLNVTKQNALDIRKQFMF
jgi:integrase